MVTLILKVDFDSMKFSFVHFIVTIVTLINCMSFILHEIVMTVLRSSLIYFD